MSLGGGTGRGSLEDRLASQLTLKEDLRRAREWVDTMAKQGNFKKNQARFFRFALDGFGGGWTEEVLQRAAFALKDFRTKGNIANRANMFTDRVSALLPQAEKRLESASEVAGVMFSEEALAELKATVYIFFAARDKPELLKTL